ncbi:MAG: hypothetical protein ACRDN8_10225, partial [Thermoleophilaceae bacterium]
MFETTPPPVPPEDEPVTSRDEAGEPSGEEDLEPDDSVASIERERDEYLDLARRAQADFEN